MQKQLGFTKKTWKISPEVTKLQQQLLMKRSEKKKKSIEISPQSSKRKDEFSSVPGVDPGLAPPSLQSMLDFIDKESAVPSANTWFCLVRRIFGNFGPYYFRPLADFSFF